MIQANTSQREHTAESIIGKKNLLITIGDSWTWGDSLGSTTLEFNDKQTRHKQFYTNLLAKKLEADWIMLARCGCDNSWIIDQYTSISKKISNGYYGQYDKVYVHVCLTELFRELEHKEYQDNLRQDLVDAMTFDEFCKIYFQRTITDRLVKPIPKLHSFSKNFWDINSVLEDYNFVPEIWQQLLFDETNIKNKVTTPMLSGLGIYPLTEFLKDNKLKKLTYEFSDMLIKINETCDALIQSPLNSQVGTKHPTSHGHQIWANNLYNYYATV